MSLSPMDFMVMAEDGLKSIAGEAGYRNAISRSYYAAYHAAVSCLNNGKLPKYNGKETTSVKGGVHAKLAYYFTNDAHEDLPYEKEKLEFLGVHLKMAHRTRVIADYKIERSITAADSEAALLSANNIIEMIADMKKMVKELHPETEGQH